MSFKSDQLAILACTQQVTQYVEGIGRAAAGIGRLIEGDVTGLGDTGEGIVQAVSVLEAEIASRSNCGRWAGYLTGLAQKGTLLASAGDAAAWYNATHKGCSGPRNTKSGTSKTIARYVGMMLAVPRITEANKLTYQELVDFEKALRAQGMDGLKPVWGRVLDAYKGTSSQIEKAAAGITSATRTSGRFRAKARARNVGRPTELGVSPGKPKRRGLGAAIAGVALLFSRR